MAKPSPFPRVDQEYGEILTALLRYRSVFWIVAGFSGVINMLMLAPSIYMMQMYDRVLNSRSETTLIVISLVVLGIYIIMSMLEHLRTQILVRLGNQIDGQLSDRIFTAVFERNLRARINTGGAAMNDLNAVRQFVTGNGLFAFFDVPWTPIYIIVIWLFSPVLGMLALALAAVNLFLGWLNERITKQSLLEANIANRRANDFVSVNLRNAEVIDAMGMLPALRSRWREMQEVLLLKQSIASDRAGHIQAYIKFLRLFMQSSVLGLGAYLVINNEASPGIMIAASILATRALSPLDMAIASWKQFSTARISYERLEALLKAFPPRGSGMSLPAPQGFVSVESLVGAPPGASVAVLKGVSFSSRPGEVLVVIGPTGSGKSTLARMLVGVWRAQGGKVRIDNADVSLWNKDELGPSIGYLPQDIELFDGTIAENIARFGDINPELVIAAAKKAGMHEMILQFAQGYDTPVGENGNAVSGGQRQRIALARALYGNPAILILDEPNSNLDEAGEEALVQSIHQAKTEGKTIILATHRPSIISVADNLLVMRDGKAFAHGPRDKVLAAMAEAKRRAQQAAQAAEPAKVAPPEAAQAPRQEPPQVSAA